MIAGADNNLPYGNIPRLLLAWVCTEAVRTQSRVLVPGRSLSGFMRKLGMAPIGGGSRGERTRLRNQMKRLFNAHVQLIYEDQHGEASVSSSVASRTEFWWNERKPDEPMLWDSKIELGWDFFNEIIRHPVPLDMNTLKALKRCALGLDLYLWLTYRTFALTRPLQITWRQLYRQFGLEPDKACDKRTVQNFRRGSEGCPYERGWGRLAAVDRFTNTRSVIQESYPIQDEPEGEDCFQHKMSLNVSGTKGYKVANPARLRAPPGSAPGISHAAKPQVGRTLVGPDPVAEEDRHALWSVGPGAPPNHFVKPFIGALRIALRRSFVVGAVEPIRTPLGNASGHIVEPEAVGRELSNRSRPSVDIKEGFLTVHGIAAWVIAAWVARSRRAFPFGFRRQTLPLPGAIGTGIVPIDVINRIQLVTLGVLTFEPMVGRLALRCLDKLCVAGVCDLLDVHEIGVEPDLVVGKVITQNERPHAGLVVVGQFASAHHEIAGRNENHAFGGSRIGNFFGRKVNRQSGQQGER